MLVYWRVAILGGSNNIYIYICISMTTLGDLFSRLPCFGLYCNEDGHFVSRHEQSKKTNVWIVRGYFGNPY